MPRMVKLSKTLVLDLITEVSRRPCLWDVDDIKYKDRKKVSRAWRDIAKQLNAREHILRLKWKNLRDTLNREIKKYNIKPGDSYPGLWRYYTRLHFMHNHFTSKYSENEDFTENSILPDTTHDIYADESDDATLYEDQNVPEREYFDVNIETTEPSQGPEDFDLMFLKSLLPFFQSLEPYRKLRVRSQIQDLIFHELTAKMWVEVTSI